MLISVLSPVGYFFHVGREHLIDHNSDIGGGGGPGVFFLAVKPNPGICFLRIRGVGGVQGYFIWRYKHIHGYLLYGSAGWCIWKCGGSRDVY